MNQNLPLILVIPKNGITKADTILFFCFPVEREHVQKKTFTKWVNSHLCRINCRVVDLYTDLRDGKLLIKLLEILSGERLVKLIYLALIRLPALQSIERH